ncbi:MAG: DUF3179 domain-containing protein [Actinomycetota bacterium]|nr:DUF3179 domain-containing protein [Actinomycetota bacterium]
MLGASVRGRTSTWLVGLALTAAACTSATGSTGQRPASPPPWPWDRAAAGERVPSLVPLEEIRSGGPPPDGIPPIDAPVFEGVAAARGWLQPRDPVLVVDLSGEARAYPLAILTYHEIVNDVVAGEPLVVTYCPLCNSGLVFQRTVDGEVLDFGTSGRLWNSNLVMYDRSTRSLWSQFSGEAIVGDRLGTRLERVPMQIVALSEFADRWPDGRVLSRDTGHDRPYGTNPYVGYDSAEAPALFDGETGGALPQMARVVTTGGRSDPVAVAWRVLRRERVVADTVGGQPVVVLWAPGTASPLDSASISEGKDVGATGVFRPIADGRRLTLVPAGEDRFRDEETASTWTVLGEAVDGPLTGTQLDRVAHDDTFWFVQYAFRPDTRVVDPP